MYLSLSHMHSRRHTESNKIMKIMHGRAFAYQTGYYISSHIHHPLIHSARALSGFSSAEVVSVIQAVTDAEEELTKYFQAAIANPISGIKAPVDTMEQQAEHCQVEKMQGGEKWENK